MGTMPSTGLRSVPWKLAAAIASLVVLASGGARAGDDPRSAVAQLESDTAHHAIVAEALARAREALERATRLHAVRDESHATEADALALEWAAVGRDLVRAADAEASAAETRRQATDAQAQLERSKALVEEAIARVGRLETEIAQTQRSNRPTRIAVESHANEPAADRPAVVPPKRSAASVSTPRGSDATP
jgi:hypothetical protein